MNIFTFIENSTEVFYIQPDTVICREGDKGGEEYKFYRPDGIEKISVIPFIYVRVERPCKAVQNQFASRHYSHCGYGVHLVSDDVEQGSVLDNSVFLAPQTPIEKGQNGQYEGFNEFDLAIEQASRYITLRVGDYIVLDLPKNEEFTIKENSTHKISFKDLKIEVVG